MEQRPKRAAPPTAWKPGQSGNPKGRPRSGMALAEALRELPLESVVERVKKALGSSDDRDALAAATFVANHGYSKPESKHELTLNQGKPAAYDHQRLTEAEQQTLHVLLAKARIPAELTEGES